MTGELRNAATNGKDTMYDVVIIGAGPTGLFASFYAGMRGMRTLILDALPEPGYVGRHLATGLTSDDQRYEDLADALALEIDGDGHA